MHMHLVLTLTRDGGYPSGWCYRCLRTLVRHKEHICTCDFQQECPGTSQTRRKHTETPRGCTEFSWFWMSCVSGTARWENLVPDSYCRATQELLIGGWIMGIGLSEPKHATFYASERLRIACTKLFTAKLMDISEWWDLNHWTVEELLHLLVFI